MSLKETALITGAAKRIGRSLALALANDGYQIALHYNHSKTEADHLLTEIKTLGSDGALFECDLSDPRQTEKLIQQVFYRFPDCSLIINNASIFERGNILDTDFEKINNHFNINFFAPFLLTRDFAQVCQNGHIINILDTKIKSQSDIYFAYSLTKKALRDLTLMSAKSLGPNIRVNGIAPGFILPSVHDTDSNFNKMSQKIPLRKSGDVDKIVSAMRFLLENDFVTGEVIYVDGGEHLG